MRSRAYEFFHTITFLRQLEDTLGIEERSDEVYAQSNLSRTPGEIPSIGERSADVSVYNIFSKTVVEDHRYRGAQRQGL